MNGINVDELVKQLEQIRSEMDEILFAGPKVYNEHKDRYEQLKRMEKEITSILWWK